MKNIYLIYLLSFLIGMSACKVQENYTISTTKIPDEVRAKEIADMKFGMFIPNRSLGFPSVVWQ